MKRITLAARRLIAIAVATAFGGGAALPARSEPPPAPAPAAPASAAIQVAPYRSNLFTGVGFYNGEAERAGSLRGSASTRGQRSFASPEAAVNAFVAALETMDYSALDAILGFGNRGQLSSGNAEVDALTREQFLQAYRAKHALATQHDGSRVLHVGHNAWPLPVPIVAADGRWYLDGAASAGEIIHRGIGHNELGAIAVCRGFVDAQKAYASEGRDGQAAGIFADRLISDPGRQNGLHWRTAKGAPPSPASAPVTGIPFVPGVSKKLLFDLAPKPSDAQKPFHGYYFRMLFAQGAHAKGGEAEYAVDGKLTRGIALIAWPADYGASGVMSFMVNHEGIVYQKDLGADTASVVENISKFDPEGSWSIVEATDNKN